MEIGQVEGVKGKVERGKKGQKNKETRKIIKKRKEVPRPITFTLRAWVLWPVERKKTECKKEAKDPNWRG